MNEYRDFNYVSYILESDFDKGYSLFLKLKDRYDDKIKDRYWELFLVDRGNGSYKGSFGEYYKENNRQSKQNLMTHDEKVEEEKRIIQKVENINWSKLKKKEVFI